MKKKILASIVFLAIVPSMALAQATVNTTYFSQLVTNLKGILNSLIPLLIAAAVVYFLWGVLQFVASGDDEEKRKAGRSRMINGVIAIFVMVSVWGLIGFLGNVTGIGLGSSLVPPPTN